METVICFWTDREERHYARLRLHGRHWTVEWGERLPPGSDAYSQIGKLECSRRDQALRLFHRSVRDLSGDLAEADHAMRLAEEAMPTLPARPRKASRKG